MWCIMLLENGAGAGWRGGEGSQKRRRTASVRSAIMSLARKTGLQIMEIGGRGAQHGKLQQQVQTAGWVPDLHSAPTLAHLSTNKARTWAANADMILHCIQCRSFEKESLMNRRTSHSPPRPP